jgi:hypothetical protein
MGTIEDLRKVLQDFLAPELRAIAVKLDSLEKRVDDRFASAEKRTDDRFTSLEKHIDERFNGVNLKFETLTNVIVANHATVMNALDLDRRMERVEARLAQSDTHV